MCGREAADARGECGVVGGDVARVRRARVCGLRERARGAVERWHIDEEVGAAEAVVVRVLLWGPGERG